MTAVIRVIPDKFIKDGKLRIRNSWFIKKTYTPIPVNRENNIEVYGARFESAHSTRGGLYIFALIEGRKHRQYVNTVYVNDDGFAFENGKDENGGTEYGFIYWNQIKNRENKNELARSFAKTYSNIISNKTVPIEPVEIYPVNDLNTLKHAAKEVLYKSAFV